MPRYKVLLRRYRVEFLPVEVPAEFADDAESLALEMQENGALDEYEWKWGKATEPKVAQVHEVRD